MVVVGVVVRSHAQHSTSKTCPLQPHVWCQRTEHKGTPSVCVCVCLSKCGTLPCGCAGHKDAGSPRCCCCCCFVMGLHTTPYTLCWHGKNRCVSARYRR